MDRFVGWLGRRGAAASALGIAAALAGDALAESRKRNRNGGERANRDERQGDDEERDKQRRARDEKDDRDNRSRDEDDDRDRGERRGSASSEQDADDDRNNDGDDRGDAAQDATTPTPVPTAPAGVPTTPTPPAVGETNASIEDAQGNVIVGFDPESGSVVARSGNVAAISGPGGPTVIINDDEVVAPVPADGVTPVPTPEGGDNGTGFES